MAVMRNPLFMTFLAAGVMNLPAKVPRPFRRRRYILSEHGLRVGDLPAPPRDFLTRHIFSTPFRASGSPPEG